MLFKSIPTLRVPYPIPSNPSMYTYVPYGAISKMMFLALPAVLLGY